MKSNDVFDLKRFWMVLRNDLTDNWKMRLLIIGLLELMIPVFSIFLANTTKELTESGPDMSTSITNFVLFQPYLETIILIIIGMFFSANSLNHALNAKHSALTIYLLPASQLEKYVSKFFVVTFGYFFVLLGMIVSGYFLSKWGNLIISHRVLEPLSSDIIKKIHVIIVLFFFMQSTSFFGGLLFRKNPAVKTIAILVILYTIGGLISYAFKNAENPDFINPLLNALTIEEQTIVNFIFFIGLPPFFWILSYIRLTETEGQ